MPPRHSKRFAPVMPPSPPPPPAVPVPAHPAPAGDFTLPGRIMNPCAYRKWKRSAAAAYSRQWNPRNLEAPWYEVWDLILSDLVANTSRLAVAGQYRLWYSDIDIVMPNHAANEVPFDAGETTFSSYVSDEGEGGACIPDFVITRKVAVNRVSGTPNWPGIQRRIRYVGIPLLCECKPSGQRCSSLIEGSINAKEHIINARLQLELQGHHLFKMYPDQQSVILLAVSGFWWSYCIAERDELQELKLVDYEGKDEYVENPEDWLLEQDGIHYATPDHKRAKEDDSGEYDEEGGSSDENESVERSSEEIENDFDCLEKNDSNENVEEGVTDDESDDELLLHPYDNNNHEALKGVKPPPLHPILTENRFSLRTRDWSPFLLLEEPASNQVFYLIHERLMEIVENSDYTRG